MSNALPAQILPRGSVQFQLYKHIGIYAANERCKLHRVYDPCGGLAKAPGCSVNANARADNISW